jgi:hypothetical protein
MSIENLKAIREQLDYELTCVQNEIDRLNNKLANDHSLTSKQHSYVVGRISGLDHAANILWSTIIDIHTRISKLEREVKAIS